MPIDTSIYQNTGQKPLDIGGLIEMARGAQRLQAESSLGDIYAGATNPDGTIDAGKLGAATNMRRAGVMAPELAARTQQLTKGQNDIDRQKLEDLKKGVAQQRELTTYALKLSEACRQSIERGWGYALPALPPQAQ